MTTNTTQGAIEGAHRAGAIEGASPAGAPRVGLLSTGGPTALIELGGLRFVTDPTFDEPRDYVSSSGAALVKTAPAALGAQALGRVDAVLLSHDHHPDNLDQAGRVFLTGVPLVLTTIAGAARLSGQDPAVTAQGLAPWERRDLVRPDGAGVLTVTAVPALHGPEGFEERTGPVIGFVLSGAGLPTVYVSGDNASLDLVRRIAERCGPVDTAVLFAGAARVPVHGEALLTLDAAGAAEAARILGSRRTVVLHCDGWAHFSEDFAAVEAAFDEAGLGASLSRTRHGRPYAL